MIEEFFSNPMNEDLPKIDPVSDFQKANMNEINDFTE
jgi:hypothetical protein